MLTSETAAQRLTNSNNHTKTRTTTNMHRKKSYNKLKLNKQQRKNHHVNVKSTTKNQVDVLSLKLSNKQNHHAK